MGKMTVAEAAQHFNVSKEAIHNRIRRGTLDCTIENGVKYVAVGGSKAAESAPSDDRYYSYIEKENERLKAKIDALEHETKRLREQREQMLIDERKKVEQIYKERDEQLKNVLQVVASKFLAQTTVDSVIDEAAVTAEVVASDDEADLVSLKEFMKLKQFKKKKREKLKERFKKLSDSDERIFESNGKLHIKPNHFDYSDLIG